MRIYPPIFKIPGLQQKAGAAHELKPLSIPPVTSGDLRDPVFTPGSLGLTCNRGQDSVDLGPHGEEVAVEVPKAHTQGAGHCIQCGWVAARGGGEKLLGAQ